MQSPSGLLDVLASDKPFLLAMYLLKDLAASTIVMVLAIRPITIQTLENMSISYVLLSFIRLYAYEKSTYR